jgi:two-component system, OmpR family, response regulator
MLKVLVVEDEPTLVQLLQANLEFEGYEILIANDGREALEMVRSQAPDVMLLDVMMPVLDGWDVLRFMRGGGIDTRVIVVTARAEDDERLRAWELGCDEFITKPFDIESLLQTVFEVAGRSGDERSARRARAIADITSPAP